MPPKAKTPMKKPIATMTIDEKRAYKLAHYYKNKDAIQKERVTTGILNGTRKIKQSTLDKYGIKKNDDNTTYEELDSQYKRWDGIATITQRTKSSSTLFYSFDAIKSEVLRVFGQKSYENLLMMLYDNVIARDDFQLTMANEKSDMVSSDVNYLYLISQNESEVHMNTFKTKDERIIVKYLRHSIISTKLMKLDKNASNYAEKVNDLANRSMHSAGIQSAYVSPLKNLKGEQIFSIEDADESIVELKEHFTRSKRVKN
ncbi:hypothetical protein T492DRAFT_846456 [Pavlovales sp. CCMP2436]|nr:hypothetical protein T492DRAFT_846456 [Pavlovales sp. CCMP2436]